jgi:hypothetical protein
MFIIVLTSDDVIASRPYGHGIRIEDPGGSASLQLHIRVRSPPAY